VSGVPVGFTLQPEEKFLELLEPVIRRADYYEVAPETLWRELPNAALVENGFHRRFAALKAKSRKPFVAHGVGLSMGSASDAARRKRWLKRVREDHGTFEFGWYTDHLGQSEVAGQSMTLPLPLQMTAANARVVQRRLRDMQRVVPDVGVENSVVYFLLGDALEEPEFLERIVSAPRMHLLLDLHNVHTMAENFGFDAQQYVDRLPLERVIEIHLSGGDYSDPAWLDSGAVKRLDGHDGAVPEAVWALTERTLARCRNLRGVTLERMEGSVEPRDVPLLAEELRRLKKLVAR
jgi:uncharacterized protein (UPF0276 family)